MNPTPHSQPHLLFLRHVGGKLNGMRQASRVHEPQIAPRFNAIGLLAPFENDLSRVLADLLSPTGSHGQGSVMALAALGLPALAADGKILGLRLRSLRAGAEAQAARGDLTGAIDRMRSGLRQSRGREADPVEASVIDARLRTMLYERRQRFSEMYPRGVPPGAELP